MFLLLKGRLLEAIIRVITNDWHKKREQTYYACPDLLCEALWTFKDAGDLDLTPSIHMAPHNRCNSSSKGSGTRRTYGV